MKLDDVFDGVALLGIDTSPFIYFVERNPDYLDVMRDVFRRITEGQFFGCTSVVTITEVLVLPFRQSALAVIEEYKDLLFHGINFQVFPINTMIAERAARLRADHNLHATDALQIATAVENNCEIFLCNDKTFRRVTDLRIILLDELEL